MNIDDIDDSVRIAFRRWLRASKFLGGCTRKEQGKLGAERRELNRVLRRRGLSFADVAPILEAEN